MSVACRNLKCIFYQKIDYNFLQFCYGTLLPKKLTFETMVLFHNFRSGGSWFALKQLTINNNTIKAYNPFLLARFQLSKINCGRLLVSRMTISVILSERKSLKASDLVANLNCNYLVIPCLLVRMLLDNCLDRYFRFIFIPDCAIFC